MDCGNQLECRKLKNESAAGAKNMGVCGLEMRQFPRIFLKLWVVYFSAFLGPIVVLSLGLCAVIYPDLEYDCPVWHLSVCEF